MGRFRKLHVSLPVRDSSGGGRGRDSGKEK